MKHHNYSVVFRREKTAQGVAEVAPTVGVAIAQAIARTEYELEDLVEIREVFSQPSHDKFFPS